MLLYLILEWIVIILIGLITPSLKAGLQASINSEPFFITLYYITHKITDIFYVVVLRLCYPFLPITKIFTHIVESDKNFFKWFMIDCYCAWVHSHATEYTNTNEQTYVSDTVHFLQKSRFYELYQWSIDSHYTQYTQNKHSIAHQCLSGFSICLIFNFVIDPLYVAIEYTTNIPLLNITYFTIEFGPT